MNPLPDFSRSPALRMTCGGLVWWHEDGHTEPVELRPWVVTTLFIAALLAGMWAVGAILVAVVGSPVPF